MSRNGIKFTDGKEISTARESDIAYDTKNGTLQIDTLKTPSHLSMIDPLKTCSTVDFVFNSGTDTFFFEETLFEIEHNLGYEPDFTCYFYCYDSPSVTDIGAYRLDYYRVGTGGEYIRATTDDKYFRITHSAAINGWPGFPLPTFPQTISINRASQMKFRVKYMIHNRPSIGYLTY